MLPHTMCDVEVIENIAHLAGAVEDGKVSVLLATALHNVQFYFVTRKCATLLLQYGITIP